MDVDYIFTIYIYLGLTLQYSTIIEFQGTFQNTHTYSPQRPQHAEGLSYPGLTF
jgi:hypothetical protein